MGKLLEDLAERFELPAEAAAGVPKISITGGRSVLIENHRGLLEYSPELVEVAGGRMRVRIRGSELRLKAMNSRVLIVTGCVFGVDVE